MLSCFSHIQLFAILWSTAHKAPLSMAFSRPEYWSGLPYYPPADLSKPEIEPASLASPALAGRFFSTSTTCCSVAQLCSTFCSPMDCSLLKLMPTESVMPSNHFVLCHPILLPSVFPSVRVIYNESALCTRWPKYWSFSFSLSDEYPGLISFMIDWFDLLAVQGTLKSLFQHHSSKASVLRCSASFMVQLSHPHMTTGKTIDLTIWTFVGKIMSLLFNMLSRFVIAFLPRSKCLSISWLQSPSAVILELYLSLLFS